MSMSSRCTTFRQFVVHPISLVLLISLIAAGAWTALTACNPCGDLPFEVVDGFVICDDGANNDDTAAPVSGPTGACCFSLDCEILTEANCTAEDGTYLGDDTSCSNACI